MYGIADGRGEFARRHFRASAVIRVQFLHAFFWVAQGNALLIPTPVTMGPKNTEVASAKAICHASGASPAVLSQRRHSKLTHLTPQAGYEQCCQREFFQTPRKAFKFSKIEPHVPRLLQQDTKAYPKALIFANIMDELSTFH